MFLGFSVARPQHSWALGLLGSWAPGLLGSWLLGSCVPGFQNSWLLSSELPPTSRPVGEELCSSGPLFWSSLSIHPLCPLRMAMITSGYLDNSGKCPHSESLNLHLPSHMRWCVYRCWEASPNFHALFWVWRNRKISSFPHCYNKIPRKSNIREVFCLTFLRSWWESHGSRKRRLVMLNLQSGSRGRQMLIFSFPSRSSAHGMTPSIAI